MKKVIYILAFVIISPFHSACSQTAKPDTELKEQKSKAELFSNKSGSLIQKQFMDVGSLRGCQVRSKLPNLQT